MDCRNKVDGSGCMGCSDGRGGRGEAMGVGRGGGRGRGAGDGCMKNS
jgi:hypothetical protein